tara:strand:- start:121 stop:477 length:357 start_codon:yes stop_codon:yes gene_type:complete
MSSWTTIVKKNKIINDKSISKSNIKKTTNNTISKKKICSTINDKEINLLFEETNGEILEKYIYELTNNYKKEYNILDNLCSADIEKFFYNYIDRENSIEIKEPETNQDLLDDEDYEFY